MNLKTIFASLLPKPSPLPLPVAKPQRPKVIGIGLWKTGTTTLGQCLKTLGYSLSEYDDEAIEAVGRNDIAAALDYAAKFDALEDYPWFLLYKELDERFPGARFILTTRKDDATWHGSTVKHAARHTAEQNNRNAAPMTDYYLRNNFHLGRWEAFHSMHNAAVQAYFADRPNDLLTVCWENGDGWKQLCDFLGDTVPEGVPFPHANAAPPPDAVSAAPAS